MRERGVQHCFQLNSGRDTGHFGYLDDASGPGSSAVVFGRGLGGDIVFMGTCGMRLGGDTVFVGD